MDEGKFNKDELLVDGEASVIVGSTEFERFEFDKDVLADGLPEVGSVLIMSVGKIKKTIDKLRTKKKPNKDARETYKLPDLADLIVYEAFISGASLNDVLRWVYDSDTLDELLEGLVYDLTTHVAAKRRITDFIEQKRSEAMALL